MVQPVKALGGGLDVGLGVGADAHGEQLEQLAPVVLVGRVLVVVLVVQPENHGRVAGQLGQQIPERAQPVAPEGVGLVDHGLGMVELAVGRGEEAVPEEGYLLLQRTLRVNHAVKPVGLGTLDEHEAVLVDVVAPEQGIVPRRGVFGVQQAFDGGFVPGSHAIFQFFMGCAESGPPHQVSNEG